MTNETLKEEWREFLKQNIFSTHSADIYADWWLAKIASHDALLLKRLEEKSFHDEVGDKIVLFEDIKLLITNKE